MIFYSKKTKTMKKQVITIKRFLRDIRKGTVPEQYGYILIEIKINSIIDKIEITYDYLQQQLTMTEIRHLNRYYTIDHNQTKLDL